MMGIIFKWIIRVGIIITVMCLLLAVVLQNSSVILIGPLYWLVAAVISVLFATTDKFWEE